MLPRFHLRIEPDYWWLGFDGPISSGTNRVFVSKHATWSVYSNQAGVQLVLCGEQHSWGPTFIWKSDNKLHFRFGMECGFLCNKQVIMRLIDRFSGLDVPEIGDANRAALRQFLEQAAQLL